MPTLLRAAIAAIAGLFWSQAALANCTTTGAFAGPYIGATLGVGTLNAQQLPTDEPTISRSINGLTGGGLLGYNLKCGRWVLGAETDISYLGLSADTQQYSTAYKSSIDWYGSVRGRLGALIRDDTMLYGTMGLAYASRSHWVQDTSYGLLQDDKSIATGLIVGGGIERLHADRWTLRAEAFWVDLGKESREYVVNGCGGVCRSTADWKDNFFTARLGLSLKFGEPERSYQPLK